MLLAQSNISGQWFGTITQNEGGFRSKYDFELYLFQEGNKIKGRSYVYVDNIYAVMELIGELQGGQYLKFKEIKMVDFSEMEGMEWCIKQAQLFLKLEHKTMRLEGNWQGDTSFGTCIPGKIFLKKTIPRA